MNLEQLREYAEFLVRDAASEIEYLSIFEMWEQFAEGEISDDDAKVVDELLGKATITVSFPDIPAGSTS